MMEKSLFKALVKYLKDERCIGNTLNKEFVEKEFRDAIDLISVVLADLEETAPTARTEIGVLEDAISLLELKL